MQKDTKDDEQKTERFNMFMTPTEMKEIEEWAWANRIRSKSEAVRRLCQVGLLVGAELEGLADAAIDMSDSMTALDKAVFGFWATIADPDYKSETLKRDAVIEAISAVLLRMSNVHSGAESVSTVLAGLYAAAAGITNLDSAEGKKRSDEVLQGVKESLQKLRELQLEREENRRLMAGYTFRSSQTPKEGDK